MKAGRMRHKEEKLLACKLRGYLSGTREARWLLTFLFILEIKHKN